VYDHPVESLISSGVLLDAGMIYFDARSSAKYPDAGDPRRRRVPDGRGRHPSGRTRSGLVETAVDAWRRGEQPPPVRTELLRMANWRAARSGLDGELVSVLERRPVPAKEPARRSRRTHR
jgi:glutamate---cysteine ligase / carboxylate-amine ligase